MASSKFGLSKQLFRSAFLMGIIGLVLAPLAPLAAQTTDPAITLQALGYTVQVQTVDGQREYALQGIGYPIAVLADPQFTDASTAFLAGLVRTLNSLETIKVSQVKVTLKAPESTALVLVSGLSADGTNLVPNLPEGIFLRYIDAIYYDFSMIVDSLRLRIRGQYFSEEELVAKLGRIYKNPNDYLLSQDSEYVFTYLQKIQAENEALRAELAKLRDGVILSGTRGFFGDWFEFDRSEVDALIQWKSENPSATQKEAEDWAKAQGFKLSWNQIQMALVVYFNQWK